MEELHVRAFKGRKAAGDFYRGMFTYLVRLKNGDIRNLRLNGEHAGHAWVDKREIRDPRYDSLHPEVRRLIEDVLRVRRG